MKNKTAKKERDKKETQSAHLAAAPIGGDDKKLLDEVLKTYSGLSREKARAIGEAFGFLGPAPTSAHGNEVLPAKLHG